MKATELQIGDLVYLADDIYLKVEQITKHKVGYHTKANECKMHYERLCDIEPITLTSEILKEIGFTKESYGYPVSFYYLPLNDKDIECAIKHYVVGGFELVITDNRSGGILRMCIQYVHELQHALKLCKIEKEIRL